MMASLDSQNSLEIWKSRALVHVQPKVKNKIKQTKPKSDLNLNFHWSGFAPFTLLTLSLLMQTFIKIGLLHTAMIHYSMKCGMWMNGR